MKKENRLAEKPPAQNREAFGGAIARLLAIDLYVLAFLIPLKFGVPNLDVASPLIPSDLAGCGQYLSDFLTAFFGLRLGSAIKVAADALSSPWPEEMAQILIVLAFFLWGMKSLSQRRLTLRVGKVDGAMGLFVLAGFVATLLSASVHSSMVVLKQFVSYALLYFVVVHSVDTRDQQRRILRYFLISTSVVAVLALYQFLFGFGQAAQAVKQQIPPELQPDYLARISRGRVFSVFVYPNSLAGFLLLVFPLTLLYMTLHREWFRRRNVHKLVAYLVVLPIACLVSFLLTQSKAGLLTFFLMAAAAVVAARKKLGLKPRVLLVGFVVAVLLLSAFLLSHTGRNLIIQKGLYTLSERVDYWKAGCRMFLRSPVIGNGFNSFGWLYPQYRLQGAGETQSAHNNYLQILVETGAVGFVFFVGIWVFALAAAGSFVRKYLRGETSGNDPFANAVALSAFAGILCFLLHSFADFDLYIPGIAMTVWLFLALMVRNARRTQERTIRLSHRWASLCTLALAALCGFGMFFAAKTLNANAHFAQAQSLLNDTDTTRPPDYEGAIAEIRKAIWWDGTNHNLHFYLAGIYVRLHWYDEALSEYAVAHRLHPFSPKIALAIASTRLEEMRSQGKVNWEEVLAGFRRAVELSPANPFHHLVYAYYLSQSGEQQLSQRELQEVKRLDPTGEQAIKTARIIYRNEPIVEELKRFFEGTNRESQPDHSDASK